jgi:hypothetical protein
MSLAAFRDYLGRRYRGDNVIADTQRLSPHLEACIAGYIPQHVSIVSRDYTMHPHLSQQQCGKACVHTPGYDD